VGKPAIPFSGRIIYPLGLDMLLQHCALLFCAFTALS
jgi:hypothetical protein